MYNSRATHSEVSSSIPCDAEKSTRIKRIANNYVLQLTAYEVREGINEAFYENGILYLLICLTVRIQMLLFEVESVVQFSLCRP
jgi:hypothetical protein